MADLSVEVFGCQAACWGRSRRVVARCSSSVIESTICA